MNKFSVAMKKFGGFMKRNAFYFLIVLCIASVAAVIALAVTRPEAGGGNNVSIGGGADDNDPVIKPEDPDDGKDPEDDNKPEKPTFIAPCNGTVSKGFTLDDYVWNPTLGQGEAHTGIDFTGEDLGVFAAGDGVIKDVGYDELNGNYVVISHNDGYESAYYSLDKLTGLKKGDKVTQGQKLGEMSITQGSELLDGVHLHFEMTKNGEYINPLDVIILEEK